MLILAAGSASRMGKVKQLLSYKDTTILGKVIENGIETFTAKDVFVVLGAHAESIKKHLKYEVNYIVNQQFSLGLSSSIICGVQELLNYDAVLIALGDQPKIDSDYLQTMLNTFKENQANILASDYGIFNGVPAVFPKKYYTNLLQLKGDKGAKQLLNSKLNLIKTIVDSEKLTDIDTPEDYQKLINS